ncbi:MAG: iron ABC transporter permease [Zestosphaera sp.]
MVSDVGFMSSLDFFIKWRRKRFLVTLILITSALLIVFLTHLSLGYRVLNPLEVFASGVMQVISHDLGVEGYRLLRALAAVVVGATLAFSGYLMQVTTKNPLADPYILGVSSGALFVVVLSFMFAQPANHPLAIALRTLTAFSGGILAYLLTMLIASKAGTTPTSVLLAGVAVGTFFYSASLLPQYVMFQDIHKLIAWSMGSFVSPSPEVLALLIIVSATALIYIYFIRGPLNNLQISDDFVRQAGCNPMNLRRHLTLLASLLASVSVAWFGVIGFVGLAAPHISRRVLRTSGLVYVLPTSLVLGSLILITSDLIGKTLVPPIEIPVNVIASMIGAPTLALAIVELRRYGSGGS